MLNPPEDPLLHHLHLISDFRALKRKNQSLLFGLTPLLALSSRHVAAVRRHSVAAKILLTVALARSQERPWNCGILRFRGPWPHCDPNSDANRRWCGGMERLWIAAVRPAVPVS